MSRYGPSPKPQCRAAHWSSTRCQSVRRVVDDLDRLVLGVIRNDGKHRPEDLLPRDRHLVVDVGEDSGLHEEATVQALGTAAAAHQPRCFSEISDPTWAAGPSGLPTGSICTKLLTASTIS